ncbi:MAG: hypothetical protein JO295_02640 [Verrucomicrobia bacterium]|nr:hypothetical protein [Verrucomicrobiota bacterium]
MLPVAVNFFSTGIKEVSRRLLRQRNRLTLAAARKALDEAESALGRCGWRELTAGSTTTDDRLAEALETLRKLDADLAENALHVEELEKAVTDRDAERLQARLDCEMEVSRIDEGRKPLLDAERDLAARQQERQAQALEHDRRIAELEAESQRLRQEEASLHLPASATAQQAPDAARARDMRRHEVAARRAALPDQLSAAQKARAAVAEAVAALEVELKKTRTALIDSNRRTQAARAVLTAREREITTAVAALLKEIAACRRRAADTEAKKDRPHRVAGHALAARPEPPAAVCHGAGELYEQVQKRRLALASLQELEAGWLRESAAANRQDLRIFHFVNVTCCVLVGLSLLLVFRTPGKRDYLPADTETVVSVNVGRFTGAELTKWIQQQEPDVWRELWSGLVRKVAETPGLDVNRDVTRITRALAPAPSGAGVGAAPAQDYLLVELRLGVNMDRFLSDLSQGYRKFEANGLRLYAKTADKLVDHPEPTDPAFAQLGPRTVALGAASAVAELIHVRLGLSDDLRLDTEFLNEFSRLDQSSALRLMTLHPERLRTLREPLLSDELAGKCQLLGIAVDLEPGKPAAALFLMRAADAAEAARIAGLLRASPEQVLQLQSAGPNLFIEPPTVAQRDRGVEWHFKMTSPAAREFLERMSKLGQNAGEKTVAEK